MDQKLKFVFGAACTILCGLSLTGPAFGQVLPDDKGKVEFVHNCTACHRADMVVAVKKTPDDWRKSVDEMASRGTDGTPQDLDNVVFYLDKYFALDKPAPADAKPSTAPAADPSAQDTDRAKRVIADNGCLSCHRIEQQGASTAPSLNGLAARHTPEEIRTAIVHHHPASGDNPASSYDSKIKGEDLDDLVRYLSSLPPTP